MSPNDTTRDSAAPRPSLFSPRRRTWRALRRPTRRVWRGAAAASRVRASRREATPPRRTESRHPSSPGRPASPGISPGTVPSPSPAGRVPVPAERGGERRGGSRPVPVPVLATVPGVGPPYALLPGPAASAPVRLRLRLAHFRALFESPGRSPGARLEPDSSRSLSMTPSSTPPPPPWSCASRTRRRRRRRGCPYWRTCPRRRRLGCWGRVRGGEGR